MWRKLYSLIKMGEAQRNHQEMFYIQMYKLAGSAESYKDL